MEADIASRYCAIKARKFFSFCLNSSESVFMLDFNTCIALSIETTKIGKFYYDEVKIFWYSA